MDYASVAKKILQRVGGKENVISLVHCMTRLRFTLKDESIVDDEAVKKTMGIINDKNPDLPGKEEVAKQVGIGAVIFDDLYNGRIKDIVFSWDRMLNFDG